MKPLKAKERATRLHSLIVRSKGHCEACGSPSDLECAHIISRRYGHTRTDLKNAFCLCHPCHQRFTEHHTEWIEFVDLMIGEPAYMNLKRKACTEGKVDWDDEVRRLTVVWKAIQAR